MASQNTEPPKKHTIQWFEFNNDREFQEKMNYNSPLLNLFTDPSTDGILYNHLYARKRLKQTTGFERDRIISIHQRMQLFITSVSRCGPKPESSYLNMLVIYLIWFKLGCSYDALSALLGMKSNRLEDDINCIHPILNVILKETW